MALNETTITKFSLSVLVSSTRRVVCFYASRVLLTRFSACLCSGAFGYDMGSGSVGASLCRLCTGGTHATTVVPTSAMSPVPTDLAGLCNDTFDQLFYFRNKSGN